MRTFWLPLSYFTFLFSPIAFVIFAVLSPGEEPQGLSEACIYLLGFALGWGFCLVDVALVEKKAAEDERLESAIREKVKKELAQSEKLKP